MATQTVTDGPVNTWQTVGISGVDFDSIQFTSGGSGFMPYGIDNVVFTPDVVPEPKTTWLLGATVLGGAFLRRRRSRA